LRGGGLGQDVLAEVVNTAIVLYAEVRHRLGGMEDVVVGLRMLGRGLSVDDYGYDPVAAGWMSRVLEALYRVWWRVDVVNLERVPTRGPVMLVANHGGTLLPYDALMVATALRRDHPGHRRARPLVEDYLCDCPYLGTLLARIGAVRNDPRNARRLLEDDGAVIVFPEGAAGLGKPYRDRYRVGRFAADFVDVCLATRAILVPVSIVGAEETYPLLGRAERLGRLFGLPYLPITPMFPWLGALGLLPLPTKWTIRFGEPLNPAARYETRDPADLALVGRLREEVRQRIQRMVLESLRRRRSIFFG
jgi:1-acyl-sn-glycerol-3-phosphate acyltransferase